VGCHKKGSTFSVSPKRVSDGTVPLGRLANKQLRMFKSMAHSAFDPLWADKFFHSRFAAYQALSHYMRIPQDKCHIGEFDVDQCRMVCRAAKDMVNSIKTKGPKSPYFGYLSNHQKNLKSKVNG
jgi:hypothetical protein